MTEIYNEPLAWPVQQDAATHLTGKGTLHVCWTQEGADKGTDMSTKARLDLSTGQLILCGGGQWFCGAGPSKGETFDQEETFNPLLQGDAAYFEFVDDAGASLRIEDAAHPHLVLRVAREHESMSALGHGTQVKPFNNGFVRAFARLPAVDFSRMLPGWNKFFAQSAPLFNGRVLLEMSKWRCTLFWFQVRLQRHLLSGSRGIMSSVAGGEESPDGSAPSVPVGLIPIDKEGQPRAWNVVHYRADPIEGLSIFESHIYEDLRQACEQFVHLSRWSLHSVHDVDQTLTPGFTPALAEPSEAPTPT